MWVSRATLHTAADTPTEQSIAAALRRILDGGPEPVMVVDGRAADARGAATSTYQLLDALGLVRAKPVCCWSRSAADSWDILDLLLETVDPDATTLVVAARAKPPFRWGSVALSRQPGHLSAGPLTRPAAHRSAGPGNGFLDLVAAAIDADRD